MHRIKIKIRRIRISSLFAILGIIFLIYLFSNYGSNYYDSIRKVHSDQLFYRLYYEGELANSYFEIGYYFLNLFFNKLGVDYTIFKCILASASSLLIVARIKGYSINYFYLLILYTITMYFFDLEQSRTFFAISIVIYATKYLPLNTTQEKIKYIVMVLIATSIHVSMAFYLLVFLTKSKRFRKYTKIIFCFVIGFCVIANLIPQIMDIMGQALSVILRSERVQLWFSYRTGMGFFLCLALYIALLFLVGYAKRISYKYKNSSNEKNVKFVEDAYSMMIVLVLSLPFYLLSTEFFRLLRELFVFQFTAILIAGNICQRNLTSKQEAIIPIFLNVAVLIYAVVFMYLFSAYEFVIPAIREVF